MKLLVLLAIAAVCPAQERCPWLNAATAAGVLGGAVQAAFSPGKCRFTRPDDELEIDVSHLSGPIAKPACASPPIALKAIGNEAYECSQTASTEQVFGRVREDMFVIRLRAGQKAVRDKAANVAEQVAGNLF